MDTREWEHFLYVGKIAFYGWAFHFVPFLIMGRVTYLHHYLPTLYFSVDAVTRPGSFHFFFKALYKENKEYNIRRASSSSPSGGSKGLFSKSPDLSQKTKGLQWRK
ncbi:hypothetical protein BYT27DRAFT_6937850 [Phlegmacium glaucopus]|nr:hypothetical protein BYT27DRAFT_6937850 [Phlegmacium glaucopus]